MLYIELGEERYQLANSKIQFNAFYFQPRARYSRFSCAGSALQLGRLDEQYLAHECSAITIRSLDTVV